MSTTFSARVMAKALRLRPWITKISRNRFRVTPRTDDHGKYELTYSLDDDGLPVIESCIDTRTKESCLGFYFSGNCYHSAALAKHLAEKQRKDRAA